MMVGLILFVVGAQLAPQQAADPDLRAAISAYDALEFKDAVPLLNRALGRTELAPADRRAALAYLGRVEAVLQHEEAAVDAFSRLLVVDPTFAVAEIESPLIRAAFAKAKVRYEAVSGTSTAGIGGTGNDGTTGAIDATSEPLPLESLEPPRWYQRPVWLVALGGAALLLTTILIVSSDDGSAPRDPALPNGTLGRWELP